MSLLYTSSGYFKENLQMKFCPAAGFIKSELLPKKAVSVLLQVLWLLSFDDKNTLADAVDKYCIGVPPIQWLAWIPQLLTCLVGSEGKPLLNLISQVGLLTTFSFYSSTFMFDISIISRLISFAVFNQSQTAFKTTFVKFTVLSVPFIFIYANYCYWVNIKYSPTVGTEPPIKQETNLPSLMEYYFQAI